MFPYQNLPTSPLCHPFTMTLLRFSASTGPCLFLPTGLMTAPLTCCREPLSPPVDSTAFLPRNGKPWKGTSESLDSGIIRPSSSPLGAGFFFVAKKNKTLRACIDFRGLINITVKNKYPLPLINSAFESLYVATIFSKLDLRNTYHLVCIEMVTNGKLPLTPRWGTSNTL